MERSESIPIEVQFTANSPFKITALIIQFLVIVLIIVCGSE
ncbi:hypothetical protein DesLBE_0276 [Desulfitobacterium sp. LBE]|uniref:Uncharacterized protein n=4 Tax=root TaxID=1 RepID=A0A098AZD0_DESHA|nr:MULTISPECIES: hypothetical protein [Desulfitobacterium]ACL21093.1 hypothetical protein Dhaf_3070 [Desulfitobacterium hafniense DCB-2]EHL06470.1 hypothetical protein HMPREF0322_02866 [Desulfitobacterium hafniense DP7]MEA5022322.1 hypothetical protein [Desulfitobacterium hafniense]TWH56089.1 hypothetical protein DesLBE_0276 [Desulfitobacterium sp. LBE]CDX01984.1 Hypothetical protein DPCES_2097 [Desulfitobacterium hafniense]